ncbi:protein-arginine deiminase domain-containing protein [Streptomyces sp. ISL-22]|uniref:protein-arginine deiminase domain-containing protein n=1 Tax=unclassified Streptomyces TaxID=2593676 RepID=UPI001BEA4982|nr:MULTISPECIES: protein-arginine deiminase domain-containing protein [unclassified Streptomyces]MBT2419203.1 protein-arginine deiminase domain-containing protein [Streptomyces sp. ISL-24]MBT2431298.1 protein-arginine deiminase domain-containing protein [Streptomyces sp. ISL-22]
MRTRSYRARRTRPAERAVVVLAAAGTLLAPPAAFAADQPSTAADLRADVNRDGRVDVTGGTDTAGEDGWSVGRGAVMLPNIDDDSGRCPVTGPGGRPLSDTALARCNDAADTKVNGATDAADLARVRSVPMPQVPAGAEGRLTLTAGAKHARVFVRRGNGWEPVTSRTRLSRAELRAGVEFGVEARDVIRDSVKWDGRARIKLTVTSGAGTTTDQVTLRVAPLLTHHHLQNAQQLMVTKISGNDQYARLNRVFREGLEKEARKAGITKPLVNFTKYGDIWAQDFVEPAYVGMAGPDGRMHSMRVMLRSAQPYREAGRELFEKLRGRNVGVVQVTGVRDSEEETLNSTGNMETIPPYAHGGRSFPAGRVIMGERKDTGSKPAKAMRTLLKSQGLQDPLLLDTSWLHVGHVDEFVQFLPADTPRGWRIGVADPEAGIRLLREAEQAGHGATKMFSVPGGPRETIAQALADRSLLADNDLAASRIEANLEVLKRETGVTDAEIVRVPALYTRGTQARTADGDGKMPLPRLTRLGAELPDVARDHGQQRDLGAAPAVQTSAYVPGAVNGIVLSRDHYLAPRQWGPVIDGKDIFTQAVTRAYTGAGMKVAYLDDWNTYHLGMGEVHCGTNTLRDVSGAWWKR